MKPWIICVWRRAAASEGSFGQLTIFYDGKVNVYEGVPPDKVTVPHFLNLIFLMRSRPFILNWFFGQARMIMQLAGSPNNNGCLPCDVTTTASTASPLSRTMPSCVRMGAAASSPPLPVVTSSTNVQAQQQGKAPIPLPWDNPPLNAASAGPPVENPCWKSKLLI